MISGIWIVLGIFATVAVIVAVLFGVVKKGDKKPSTLTDLAGVNVRPLLVDLVDGKAIGSFRGTIKSQDLSSGENTVDVLYTPFNSIRAKVKKGVPKDGGLVSIPQKGDMTSDLVFIVTNKNGDAPLIDKYLEPAIGEKISKLNELQRKVKIKSAAAREKGKLADRDVSSQLKGAKEISSAVEGGGKSEEERKRRRSRRLFREKEEV